MYISILMTDWLAKERRKERGLSSRDHSFDEGPSSIDTYLAWSVVPLVQGRAVRRPRPPSAEGRGAAMIMPSVLRAALNPFSIKAMSPGRVAWHCDARLRLSKLIPGIQRCYPWLLALLRVF